MPFPTKLLNDRETVALDLRPHWWYMAKSTLALVGATLLGIFIVFKGPDRGWSEDAINWASVILIAGALIWFGIRYAKWVTTNFVVTSDRVIFRQGLIAKKGIEIPLERINTVFFNQSVFERVIGAGDVAIESGGETGKESFKDIRKPSYVQNEIYRQMELNNERMYHGVDRRHPPQSVGPAVSPVTQPVPQTVTDQLERLHDLHQRGALTDEEYAAQKAKLLERM